MKHLDAKKQQKIPCGGFNLGQGIALQSNNTIMAEPDTQIWCKMSFQDYATDENPGYYVITKIYITDAEKNILFQVQSESSGSLTLMKQAVDWMVENDRLYDFSFGRVTTQVYSDGRPETISGYYPWVKKFDSGVNHMEDYEDKTKIGSMRRNYGFVSPVPTIVKNSKTDLKAIAFSYPECTFSLKEDIKAGTKITVSSFGPSATLIPKWQKTST